MRWMWIDRFIEFESGRRAVAIKNVTLVEEVIDDYFPGSPVFPPSLMVEGLAQTGGLLVGEHRQFLERVVLAKLGKASFHSPVFPGDQIRYSVELREINAQGAVASGTAHVGQELRAEVELMFAHLDDRFPPELFGGGEFMRILRLFRLYEVARGPDGARLKIPEHLLEAEACEAGVE
jgi:3-hydroxyacyl-[acyl-carrier-protein] dehydratase